MQITIWRLVFSVIVGRSAAHHAADRFIQRVLRAHSLGIFWLLFAVYFCDNLVYLFGAAIAVVVYYQSADSVVGGGSGQFLRFVQFIFSAILVQPSDFVDLLQSAVSLRHELGQRNPDYRDVLDSA